MSDMSEKLVQAHLAFEMDRLRGAELMQGIDEEVEAIFNDLEQRCLNDLISIAQVNAFIDDNIIDMELTDGLREIISHMAQQVDSLEAHDTATVNDLMTAGQFKKLVNQALSMEEARHALIHEVMQNSLYTKLISDVLYNAIKNFMLDEENGFATKLPGMSSVMKMGKGMMNRTMPKMEASIDKAVTRYISANIKNSVDLSETIINQTIESDAIDNLIDEVWADLGPQKISKFFSYIKGADIDGFTIIMQDMLKDVQKLPYVRRVIEEMVSVFFAEYGDRPIAPMLGDIGFSKDRASGQLKEHLPQLLENETVLSYIQGRIENRLRLFYSSDAFSKAMEG